MDGDFWSGKKLLVTGANGFIGSWLTEALSASGADVTAFVKKDDPIGTESISHIKKLKIAFGDIRKKDDVARAAKDKEIIFHLAAVTQVLYSLKYPEETVEVNFNGTFNILEAARKGDAFLMFASTDKVYGEPLYNPIDEDHPLSCKSPYDASKLAADRLVHAYNKTYGTKSSIVRWSNTYGGRDSNFLRAVPDFVTSMIKKKAPVIRGDGKHVRDYMHVSDAVSGIITAAEQQNISNSEAFNLGTEKPLTVMQLAQILMRLYGFEGKPAVLGKKTPGEIRTQYLSAKKARKMLGWRVKAGLEEGLKETIKWYKDNPQWQHVMSRVKQAVSI